MSELINMINEAASVDRQVSPHLTYQAERY
jgi:hypothetical protein